MEGLLIFCIFICTFGWVLAMGFIGRVYYCHVHWSPLLHVLRGVPWIRSMAQADATVEALALASAHIERERVMGMWKEAKWLFGALSSFKSPLDSQCFCKNSLLR